MVELLVRGIILQFPVGSITEMFVAQAQVFEQFYRNSWPDNSNRIGTFQSFKSVQPEMIVNQGGGSVFAQTQRSFYFPWTPLAKT